MRCHQHSILVASLVAAPRLTCGCEPAPDRSIDETAIPDGAFRQPVGDFWLVIITGSVPPRTALAKTIAFPMNLSFLGKAVSKGRTRSLDKFARRESTAQIL
jgi:hypothetical protein